MATVMAKVWAIENGSYSDYHIVGVFSTQENAERVLASGVPGDIVEWELDPGIANMNAGLTPFRIAMLRDGTTEKCDKMWPTFKPSEPKVIERSGWPHMPSLPGYNGPDFLEAIVLARDETHAVKIVNEHRARLIAANEWPPQPVPTP